MRNRSRRTSPIQRREHQTARLAITVIETVVVMILIIGCLFFLLGGSSRLADPFQKVASTLRGNGTVEFVEYQPGKSPEIPETETVGSKLIKLGVFTASALIFMSYTIYFVSRAESGSKRQPITKGEPEPEIEQQTSFVNSMLNKRNRIGRVFRDEKPDGLDTSYLHVSNFMTANPMIARVDDDVADIMNLMVTRGFRHLIIVDQHEQLVGIISDRDLVNVERKSVPEIMTPNPIWVSADTAVSIAITMLVQNRISALPVVHHSKVVGILTRSDLLVTMQCLLMNLDPHQGQRTGNFSVGEPALEPVQAG